MHVLLLMYVCYVYVHNVCLLIMDAYQIIYVWLYVMYVCYVCMLGLHVGVCAFMYAM